jgi:hypothetical protein
MPKYCEHDPITTITKVLEPRYHDKSILLSKETVDAASEILVIRFAKERPFKEYGWFVMKKDMVQKQPIQPNGRGFVYAVPLSKREEFIGIKNCKHLQQALI